MKQQELITIGYLTKTKGLKGELQLFFQIDNPEAYSKLESVFIDINNKPVPFFIEKISIRKNVAYIYFEGIDHIDKAQTLLKKPVSVSISQAPKVSKEFKPSDLKGFLVIDENIGELGPVKEVLSMPQQTLISLDYQDKEILFPYNEHFTRKLDKKNRKLLVALPDGLIDLYLE